MLEDKLNIINLIDTYGSLLTDIKLEILQDYYFEDISLGEIAQNRQISRQAVHDSISKSVEKLKNFEDNLKIISKTKEIKSILDSLLSEDKISKDCYDNILSVLEG